MKEKELTYIVLGFQESDTTEQLSTAQHSHNNLI